MCYKCKWSDHMKSDIYKTDPCVTSVNGQIAWNQMCPNPNLTHIHMCYKCEHSDHMKSDLYKLHPCVLHMWTVRLYETRMDPNHIHICYKCGQSDQIKSDMYKPHPYASHMWTVKWHEIRHLKPDPNRIQMLQMWTIRSNETVN